MKDFDVVVIGGGPAGCYAALTAAKKGCNVALFEEHRAIGRPRHDPGWLMESDFAESIINSVGKEVLWTKVKEFRVSDAVSGDIIEKSLLGGFLVRRDLLEREIAIAATKAGAKIYLMTKVQKLVRRHGKVEGITTNSDNIPMANGKVFICADGIRSSINGFAVGEGMCEPGNIQPGVSYLLTNAGVSEGIVEQHLSPDPLLNYRSLWAHRNGLCYVSLPGITSLHELKQRQDNVISRKIENAYPLEISGYALACSGKPGKYFNNIIKDNIIFIGDASGGNGNIHGMIQGYFAGKVAASAIQDNNVNEERLSEYQELVFRTLGKAPFFWLSARDDFGSFNEWFREFREATKDIKATEFIY